MIFYHLFVKSNVVLVVFFLLFLHFIYFQSYHFCFEVKQTLIKYNAYTRTHTHTHSVDRRPTAMWDYIDSIHSFFRRSSLVVWCDWLSPICISVLWMKRQWRRQPIRRHIFFKRPKSKIQCKLFCDEPVRRVSGNTHNTICCMFFSRFVVALTMKIAAEIATATALKATTATTSIRLFYYYGC